MAPRCHALLLLLGALLLAASVSADLPGVVVAPSLPDVVGNDDGATATAAGFFPRPQARRLGPEDRGPTTRSVIVVPDAPAPSSSNSKHATADTPPPPAACRDDDWDFGSFVLGFGVCALLFVLPDEEAIRVVFGSDEEATTDARGGDGAGEAELTGTAACAPAA